MNHIENQNGKRMMTFRIYLKKTPPPTNQSENDQESSRATKYIDRQLTGDYLQMTINLSKGSWSLEESSQYSFK